VHFDVRRAFIPDPGCVFVVADYVQMEFKIAGALSKDPDLVKVVNDLNCDIHIKTAAAIFDIEEEKVTPEQREAAKTLNYAIIYGVTPSGFAKQIQVSEKKAEILIGRFYKTYPGLKRWILQTHREILLNGYAETYWGRRRWADPLLLRSPVEEKKMSELRKMTNMVVQGTGADFTKIAMRKIYKQIQGMESRLVGQVHDELIVLCPLAEAARVMKVMDVCMTARMYEDTQGQVILPVKVEAKTSLSKSKDAVIKIAA
jgi:DNA polymerase-1